MLQAIELLARTLVGGFEVLGFSSTPTEAMALLGVIGLTTLAVMLTVRSVAVLSASLVLSTSLRVQRESADIAVLLTQSDPDADGHVRPRAPAAELAAA